MDVSCTQHLHDEIALYLFNAFMEGGLVIVRVNERWVFVRYSDSLQAKATAPEQLTVVTE